MDLATMLIDTLWAALFATGLGVLLTAPRQFLFPTFVCAFTGRLVRDLCTGWGLGQNWSTALGALMVVLVAGAIIRRREASPVALVCSVIPLGAVLAIFNTLIALIRLSTAKGDLLNDTSIALTSNLAKAFTTTLSIALGIGAGVAILRLLRREAQPVER
jgi:uncharacterized membrane protein YjjB (DUF3815 family)